MRCSLRKGAPDHQLVLRINESSQSQSFVALVSNEMDVAQEDPLYISENESVKDDLLIFFRAPIINTVSQKMNLVHIGK